MHPLGEWAYVCVLLVGTRSADVHQGGEQMLRTWTKDAVNVWGRMDVKTESATSKTVATG